MSEALIAEVLRPDGTPCGEGETGRMVITDLHNHATPIVRYALGDMAEMAGACPCGRGLPAIRRIVGRNHNLLRMPDGRRFWPSLGGFGRDGYLLVLPIRQFQLIQTELDLIECASSPSGRSPPTTNTCSSSGRTLRSAIRFASHSAISQTDCRWRSRAKFEDFICLV